MGLLNKIKNRFTGNAVVLMYHRIGTVPVDPWELAVSEANFESHLKILRGHFNVVPVREVLDQVASNRVTKKSICITFDDGYTDNYSLAAPLLKQYGCPATFFIATGFIDSKKMFWWDVLTAIFLETFQLPENLQIGKLRFRLDNKGAMNEEQFNTHKKWKWPAPSPTQRCEVYLAVWEHIKPLNTDEISAVIDSLVQWSGIKIKTEGDALPMSNEQLSQMSSDNLFSLGVHTVNHPALGFQTGAVQRAELTQSKQYLSNHFDTYLNAVAYPYGNYNEQTLGVIKDERFDAGFTTEEKKVKSASEVYELGRFKVNDWTGAEFKDQLNKWTSN